MATTEPIRAGGPITKTKSKDKEKEKEKERKQRPAQKSQSSSERLKTVVRRLPPNLPEDIFWQSVQPWVTEDTVSWKEYYQGKFKKRRVLYWVMKQIRGLTTSIPGSIRRTYLQEHTLPSRMKKRWQLSVANMMAMCFETKPVRRGGFVGAVQHLTA
jgi:hypothetical protein